MFKLMGSYSISHPFPLVWFDPIEAHSLCGFPTCPAPLCNAPRVNMKTTCSIDWGLDPGLIALGFFLSLFLLSASYSAEPSLDAILAAREHESVILLAVLAYGSDKWINLRVRVRVREKLRKHPLSDCIGPLYAKFAIL